MDDFTRKFSIVDEKDAEIRHILTTVYQALEEKGYNPINQIVGSTSLREPHLYHEPHGRPDADSQAGPG